MKDQKFEVMNYDRFISPLSQNREPDMIREIVGKMKDAPPDTVFLAGGLPNSDLFPFKECSVTLQDGQQITLDGKLMNTALQYGPTPGHPLLIEQLKSLTKRFHSPPMWSDSELLVCPGAQDAMSKAFSMVLSEGDYVIVQEPCYPGAMSVISPYKPRYLSIESDADGMKPSSLRDALSPWKVRTDSKTREGPKVMYVVPNACNPTGVSLNTERKEEIYKIASEYDLLIFEDDPYYFLQFKDIKNYSPSFLSLDVDGRVVRFDSFSKVLSPGIRLGFVTGPKTLIERMTLHMQSTLLHTPSLTQVIVSELLKAWGDEKFFQHIRDIRRLYESKKNMILEAANKYLKDLCEWSVPTGGMFLWIKVPSLTDTWDMVMERGLSKRVMLVPGRAFFCDVEAPSNHLRAAFSFVSSEEIDRGMKSLKELIEEEIRLQNSKKE